MVDSKPKTECCGCRACEHICPTNAIKMHEDEKGFRYPVIDYTRCTKCGLCDKVCGFNSNYPNNGNNPDVYAVKNKDESVRSSSTSGGMFVPISDYVLDMGGVVFGVGYDDHLYVCHKRATTKEARDEFKGSKYVQSDTKDTFLQAKQDLDNGRMVLFSGTPCQISSLKAFLQRDYDNLLTIDIVCHGTPSNMMWQEFLKVIERRNQVKVSYAEFRNKTIGWHSPRTKLYTDIPKRKIKGEQSYLQLFYPDYMLMPSCHNCKFTNYKRCSDFTIADFWGIERSIPQFDDDRGVSLVLVNSDAGKKVFDEIKYKLIVYRSSKENCRQGHLNSPSRKNPKSEQFWRDYWKHGMKFVMIKYTEYSYVLTFFRKAIRKVKRIIRT